MIITVSPEQCDGSVRTQAWRQARSRVRLEPQALLVEQTADLVDDLLWQQLGFVGHWPIEEQLKQRRDLDGPRSHILDEFGEAHTCARFGLKLGRDAIVGSDRWHRQVGYHSSDWLVAQRQKRRAALTE